jgi:hypothetical protein
MIGPLPAAVRLLCLLVALTLPLAGCDEDRTGDGGEPYVEMTSGGFVYNLRAGTARYGFTARVLRPIPEGVEFVAIFENPAGEPIVRRQRHDPRQSEYRFETDALSGLENGREYGVELRLRAGREAEQLARYRATYRAQFDQRSMPKPDKVDR